MFTLTSDVISPTYSLSEHIQEPWSYSLRYATILVFSYVHAVFVWLKLVWWCLSVKGLSPLLFAYSKFVLLPYLNLSVHLLHKCTALPISQVLQCFLFVRLVFSLFVRGLGLSPFSGLVCDLLPWVLGVFTHKRIARKYLASQSERALLGGHLGTMVLYLT